MQTFKYQIYCPDFEYEIGLFDVVSNYMIENENGYIWRKAYEDVGVFL